MPDSPDKMRPRDLSRRGLTHYVIETTRSSYRKAGSMPWVVAIGGYPCIGKTRLAFDVAAAWDGPSFILPTESAIAARSVRLAHGQDGSSIESHNMSTLMALVKGICEGQRLDVPKYSWSTGDFSGTETNPVLDQGGLLLIDGSVAASRMILTEVDAAFALKPDRIDIWMDLAVSRDVAERNWDRVTALQQNKAKERTVAAQLSDFGHRPQEHLIVIAVSEQEDWAASSNSP